MDKKQKALILLGVTGGAYAAGYYTAPAKTVEVVKTVEVSKEDTQKNKHKETEIVNTKDKDGTEHTKTTIVEDTSTEKSKDDTKNVQSKKTEEKSTGVTNISLLGGTSLSDPTLIYGVSITRSVLGPFTIGIWGMNDKSLGASVGLNF